MTSSVVDTPELTLLQVMEAGRPARHGPTADDSLRPQWLFRDGFFWLVYRDSGMFQSGPPDLRPKDGWHHEVGCDCRYCSSEDGRP